MMIKVLEKRGGLQQAVIVMQLALALELVNPFTPIYTIPFAIITGFLMGLISFLLAPNFFYEIELKLRATFHLFSFNCYGHVSKKILLIWENKITSIIIFLWCAWTLIFFIFIKNYEHFYLLVYLSSVFPIVFFYFLTAQENRLDTIVCYLAGLMWISLVAALVIEPLINLQVPDGEVYKLQASAFNLYWNGQDVPAAEFMLNGLTHNHQVDFWLKNDVISYAGVIGSRHYLYQLLIGYVYYFVAKAENIPVILFLFQVIMLATVAPSCFNIAWNISKSRAIATTACILILMNVGLITMTILYLRECLNLCVFFLALFTLGEFLTRQGKRWFLYLIVLFFLMILLSIIRVHLMYIIYIILGCFLFLKLRRNLWCLVGATVFMIISLLVSEYFGSYYPRSVKASELVRTQESTIKSIVSSRYNSIKYITLEDPEEQEKFFDDHIKTDHTFHVEWHKRLNDYLPDAVFSSVWRTLFTPYPGLLFYRPFTASYVEIFYFSNLIIILFFPYLIIGCIRAFKSDEGITFLAILLAVIAVYIVYMGECSHRQRLNIEPLLFIFIALGRGWVWQKRLASDSFFKHLSPVTATY